MDTAAAADVAADDVGTVVVVGAAAVEHSIADTVVVMLVVAVRTAVADLLLVVAVAVIAAVVAALAAVKLEFAPVSYLVRRNMLLLRKQAAALVLVLPEKLLADALLASAVE